MNTVAPLAMFVVFVISAASTGRTLNTASAFTGLSLISLLSSPMNTMIRAIPAFNAAMACFDRIQTFLNSDARQDHRLPLNSSTCVEEETSRPSSARGVELKELTPTIYQNDAALIVAQNASFSWTTGGEDVVRDVSFTLRRHEFCFIIGPVGSGKSTLLKGLLGETSSSKGFVYSSFPSSAYVDQTPWIRNASIQENILGVSNLDESWYLQVVRACALDKDISIMPRGHCECILVPLKLCI